MPSDSLVSNYVKQPWLQRWGVPWRICLYGIKMLAVLLNDNNFIPMHEIPNIGFTLTQKQII